MKGRIYYFTGTGNSMRAVRVIAHKLENTEIISMRNNPQDVPASDCDVVGFVYPVYHWSAPAPAVTFVQQLEINPQAYVFVIAMPGLIGGIACERIAEILRERGIRVCYGSFVYSVANYALVYPPFPPAKFRVPQAEKKLKKIAQEISGRKEKEYPRAGKLIRWRRQRVMGPYLELQKYADEPFTVSEKCLSCGLCSRVCPCHNIVMENGRPSFQHHCTNCMACIVNCPVRAIGYELTKADRKLLDAASINAPVVKLMGLPPKRKLYRNPYITANDLAKDSES